MNVCLLLRRPCHGFGHYGVARSVFFFRISGKKSMELFQAATATRKKRVFLCWCRTCVLLSSLPQKESKWCRCGVPRAATLRSPTKGVSLLCVACMCSLFGSHPQKKAKKWCIHMQLLNKQPPSEGETKNCAPLMYHT